MKLLPDSSEVYRDKMLRAERLRRILWQGSNPLGGPREDVCPIVADYTEKEIINNMKEDVEVCYSIKGSGLSTILLNARELWRAEVIILTRLLYHSSQPRPGSYRGK